MKSLIFIVAATLFFSMPLYAAEADIIPGPFEYKGVMYKFDTRYPGRITALKGDLYGDGKIETVVGLQGVTSDGSSLSFVMAGREVNGKFIPETIVPGNDRFDKVELKDVDNDKANEIVFWSSGGPHFVSLDIYKMTKAGLEPLFHNGSPCGIDIEGSSFPFKIKVWREESAKPDWRYADKTSQFELYEWDGKAFKHDKENSTVKEGKTIWIKK